MKEISIESATMPATELRELLESVVSSDSKIDFQEREQGGSDRALDPTVLVAIVEVSGAMLSALIGGALMAARKRQENKITLRGSTGRSIEVPADMPADQLDVYIQKAKELDIESLEIP